jgi:hypothetical protein
MTDDVHRARKTLERLQVIDEAIDHHQSRPGAVIRSLRLSHGFTRVLVDTEVTDVWELAQEAATMLAAS